MDLSSGITYNLRGLWLGIKTPKLPVLGLIRFAAVVIITILAASLILVYHDKILYLIWAKPANQWILWLWYVLSWLLSLLLVGLSAILSYLVKQEIPRTILPVFVILLLMVLGWLTPLGPVLAILSSGIAVLFLAWDNTDLVPARRLYPFKQRFKLLLTSLTFHLGFGLLFLIPLLNILFLSFAPVGATIYFFDKYDK
jgi:CysZ protein